MDKSITSRVKKLAFLKSSYCSLFSTYQKISAMLLKTGIWNKDVPNHWQLDATFRNNLTGAIFGG